MQWLVFEKERSLKDPLDFGGDNGDTYSDENASQVPDFMMNRSANHILCCIIELRNCSFHKWKYFLQEFFAGQHQSCGVQLHVLVHICHRLPGWHLSSLHPVSGIRLLLFHVLLARSRLADKTSQESPAIVSYLY